MKIKYYKVYEEDIFGWWNGLREDSCQRQYSPWEIVRDIKLGIKEWYYKGIPLRIKPLKGSENTAKHQN